MTEQLTIGYLIQRHIKMRGKTIKEVAAELGRNYKTFSGILKRDAVDAKLLFELANLLDIDLEWMTQLFDLRRPISRLERYEMTRMQEMLRKKVYPDMLAQLDRCIRNNPNSIAEVRKELLHIYSNVFYVLDVLMPEKDVIRVTVERGKEKYYCIPFEFINKMRGKGLQQTFDGREMLNQIILKRKEELR